MEIRFVWLTSHGATSETCGWMIGFMFTFSAFVPVNFAEVYIQSKINLTHNFSENQAI